MASRTDEEWLWGWDMTPGIVSVYAEPDGRAIVWRRIAETGALVRERSAFVPGSCSTGSTTSATSERSSARKATRTLPYFTGSWKGRERSAIW
jgi:hypothetical protein